jgi:hypothetical protein
MALLLERSQPADSRDDSRESVRMIPCCRHSTPNRAGQAGSVEQSPAGFDLMAKPAIVLKRLETFGPSADSTTWIRLVFSN